MTLAVAGTIAFFSHAAISDYTHREVPHTWLLAVLVLGVLNLSQQPTPIVLIALATALSVLVLGFALWLVAPLSAGDVKWLSSTPLVCTQPLGSAPVDGPSSLVQSYELLFACILVGSVVNALYWLHYRDESNPAMIGITVGVIAWAFIPLAV